MRRLLALLWLALSVLATPASAQSLVERLITPGPLSAPHARLEAKCDSCHASYRKEAQNGRCAACHKGVAADIAGRRGYHGKFTPARTQACKTCHSEHEGRGLALVKLDRKRFDHRFSDFALTGAHASADCAGCHGQGNNYRGVPSTCAGCHGKRDPHLGRLGKDCQGCHGTSAWKPVNGFNHAATGYALGGAHATVACMGCHAGQRWKGTPRNCASCHAKDDVHKGSRGTDCASCHRTTTWKSATFDHAGTGFPLLGAHASAACAGCHGPANRNLHPARTCATCHGKDDVHKGANGPQCESCHQTSSWKQVRFDHDRTDFPLRGAHRQAACAGCHKQPPKVASPPVTCIGCHRADDTHKGGNGEDCARCHKESAWKAVDFSHDRMTRFPLAGAHAKARCESCHVQPADKVKLSVECGSCHARDDAHKGRLGSQCARCHSSTGWKTEVQFDHGLSRFPLLGKHAAVTCADCHVDATFAAKGLTCASCHVDTHHAGSLGTPSRCESCHVPTDWKLWSFDHNARTRFALTGRHQGLICSACHTRAGDPARTGGKCIDCHRRDDRHRGRFGEDCQRCHTTSGFHEIRLGTGQATR